MTRKKEQQLPGNLSGLISLAVKDSRKAQKSKKYRLNMRILHEPTVKGKCEVCMAGAVLAFTMKVPFNRCIVGFVDTSEQSSNKFRAIDHARMGYLNSALEDLDSSYDDLSDEQRMVMNKWQIRTIQALRRDRRQRAAFSFYEKMAKELGAAGL
jgi:hypothetical protein